MASEIDSIEIVEFTYPVENVSTGPHGDNLVYEPGNTLDRHTFAVRINTDDGLTGEYVGGTAPGITQIGLVAEYLLGRDAFKRERHWSTMRRILRKFDATGIGPIDIALWDLAGKECDRPIHELLGTYRETLPAYASTCFGTEDVGFDSPDAYASFAERCLELGYPAFKTHTWAGNDERDIDREVRTLDALGDRVGDEMDLMHDPVCGYETFGTALRVGRACDANGFFWYEDPYGDAGSSQQGPRRLRERLDTPLLMTELVRGLEPHADFVVNGATDFVRADVEWDGGITGAVKIARTAEALGLDVEYHLPGPATRHCMAATRNTNYYEVGLVHPDSGAPHNQPPVYGGGYTDALDAIADDGTMPVPDGPGLGVEYDWGYVRNNQVETTVYD